MHDPLAGTPRHPVHTLRRRRRRRRGSPSLACVALVGLVATLCVAGPLTAAHAWPAQSPVEVVDGRLGVVTTESPIVSEAGLAMLRSGGNAVDAIVAAAFANGVVNFEACGLGGGGFLVYRGADGTVDSLEFYERAPGKGNPAGYTVRAGRGDPSSTTYIHDKGRGPAGIPGFLRGMEAALARYGTKTLAEVIEPAERYAREGFPISPQSDLAIELNWRTAYDLRAHSDTYRIYYNAAAPGPVVGDEVRTPKDKGQILTNVDYADTLRRIAANGTAEFYDVAAGHRTATELLAAMHADPEDPSDWTAVDLQSYRAHWRAPVTATYRGHHVHTIGGNSAGGTLVVQALNLVEGFELAALPEAQRLHAVVEAQRIAWTDRRAYYGDPGPPGQPSLPDDAWADIPPQLTSKRYADQRRAQIATGPAGKRRASYEPGRFDGYTPWSADATVDSGTAGLAAVDAAGNAVAMSCSIGGSMGSAVTPKGLGFLVNHSLEWDAGGPNGPAVGKAPRSSQTPTIVVRAGRPVLVVAGQGGSTIPMAVLNAVLEVVDRAQPIDLALDAPRIDCCGFTSGDPQGQVFAEERAGNSAALAALRDVHGHPLSTESPYLRSPVLVAAAVDRPSGQRQSSSDARGQCGPSSVEDGVTSSACYRRARADWLHWQPRS